ncbi:MAG: hypothetical protein ABR543_08045 [Gemmatimonadaceae bacterium]
MYGRQAVREIDAGGARWIVAVVARLVSEDTVTGAESARLVVRIERAGEGRRRAVIVSLAAGSLDEVDERTLRNLAAPDPVPRHRQSRAG